MWGRYEGQRDQLYSQTFNLEQVAFATEGLKDAQQTVWIFYFTYFKILCVSKSLLYCSYLCMCCWTYRMI